MIDALELSDDRVRCADDDNDVDDADKAIDGEPDHDAMIALLSER
jgi:hypothetical protein